MLRELYRLYHVFQSLELRQIIWHQVNYEIIESIYGHMCTFITMYIHIQYHSSDLPEDGLVGANNIQLLHIQSVNISALGLQVFTF